jgi:hypothetical protein
VQVVWKSRSPRPAADGSEREEGIAGFPELLGKGLRPERVHRLCLTHAQRTQAGECGAGISRRKNAQLFRQHSDVLPLVRCQPLVQRHDRPVQRGVFL